MENKRFYNEFDSLPFEAKKEVISFMSFLKAKYELKNKKPGDKKLISNKKFVGIWKNRKDMEDSAAWVKNLRSKEWE